MKNTEAKSRGGAGQPEDSGGPAEAEAGVESPSAASERAPAAQSEGGGKDAPLEIVSRKDGPVVGRIGQAGQVGRGRKPGFAAVRKTPPNRGDEPTALRDGETIRWPGLNSPAPGFEGPAAAAPPDAKPKHITAKEERPPGGEIPESPESPESPERPEPGEFGHASQLPPHAPQAPQDPIATRVRPAHTLRTGRINMNGVDHYINPRSNPLSSLLWGVVGVVFLALLGWQVKYFFVDQYARHEGYPSYLAGWCEVIACPPRRAPSRFTLTHTRVGLHPVAPGALRVTVKLVNEAAFAQPYPDLQLTLTDRDGRIVGRRAFPPARYLGEGQPGSLASGELGILRLDLARPHEKAVGFEVDIVTGPASS